MKGTKVRDLVPAVAAELELPADKVYAVHDFFWEEVRRKLMEPRKEIRIHLINLGDFVIKPWVLRRTIERYGKIVERLTGQERHNEYRQAVANDVAQLSETLAAYESELQRKEFIKQHKKIKPHVQITPDLEK